jgi:hypothetical protein
MVVKNAGNECAPMRFVIFCCFLHNFLMRFPYEILCLLLHNFLKRFPNQIVCVLQHNFGVRFLFEILCCTVFCKISLVDFTHF